MRRWIVVLLISGLVCSVHPAQNTPRRLIPHVDGPVKSVRVEVARLISDGDERVEGPKVLSSISEVNESRTLTEERRFRPDGVVDRRQTIFYDANGKAKESLVYGEEDRLLSRMVYHWDIEANRVETFNYEKDGSIRSSGETVLDSALMVKKGETREKDGDLVEGELARTEASGKRRVERASYRDGQLTEKRVTVILSTKQYEIQHYDASDELKSRTVITVDHKAEPSEIALYDHQGNLQMKEIFERVFDSHGNWIKQVRSYVHLKTKEHLPSEILYRTITYHE